MQRNFARAGALAKSIALSQRYFAFIEVPAIRISNELLADLKKMADLYDHFGLEGLE